MSDTLERIDLGDLARVAIESAQMIVVGLLLSHELGVPLLVKGEPLTLPDDLAERLRSEWPASPNDETEAPPLSCGMKSANAEIARRAIFVMAGAAHEIEKILTPEQPQPTEIKKLSLEGVRAAEAQGQPAAPTKRECGPEIVHIDDRRALVDGKIILETADGKSWRLVSNDNKSWLLAWHPDYQSAEFEAIERVRQGRWMPDTTLNDGSERPRVDRSRPAVFWGRNHRQRFDS